MFTKRLKSIHWDFFNVWTYLPIRGLLYTHFSRGIPSHDCNNFHIKSWLLLSFFVFQHSYFHWLVNFSHLPFIFLWFCHHNSCFKYFISTLSYRSFFRCFLFLQYLLGKGFFIVCALSTFVLSFFITQQDTQNIIEWGKP